RGAILAELLEDLLVLRPEHTAAMLTLGRLRFEAGETAEARQLWALAGERLDRDDPRFYRPALELAREALDTGEPTLARELAERAHELEPERDEPLALLAAIAHELDDPELAAEILAERVALDDRAEPAARLDPADRAKLELSLALALAELFERGGDRRSASAALEHFAAASRPAGPGEETRPLERWLALAIAVGDLEQQARARAALREALGDALEIPALIAEISLLDRGLDRPLAAIERCEWALTRHRSDPLLIDALAELLAGRSDAVDLAERGQRMLRASIKDLDPGEIRIRAAELLIEIGRRLEDPASVAFGLDQLAPERVEQGELAGVREWAIRKLGRVQEEIASVESKLAG